MAHMIASKSVFARPTLLLGAAILALAACSGGGPGTDSNPKVDGGDDGSCNCHVTVNGASTTLSFLTWGGDAEVAEHGQCTTKPDAGPRDSGPPSLACADDLTPSTCQVPGQYCIVGKLTRLSGAVSTDGQCVAMPAGCAACDCAVANAARAFTRAGGGCKDATVSCSDSNGAMTVTCEKSR